MRMQLYRSKRVLLCPSLSSRICHPNSYTAVSQAYLTVILCMHQSTPKFM